MVLVIVCARVRSTISLRRRVCLCAVSIAQPSRHGVPGHTLFSRSRLRLALISSFGATRNAFMLTHKFTNIRSRFGFIFNSSRCQRPQLSLNAQLAMFSNLLTHCAPVLTYGMRCLATRATVRIFWAFRCTWMALWALRPRYVVS